MTDNFMAGHVEMTTGNYSGADGLAHLVHDIEGGVNETIANTAREMHRSVAGVAHMAHRAQDDVNDQLAHSFGVDAPRHYADNRRDGGFGAPPGGDGLDDELSDEEEVELPVRRSSIWFQEERGGLYDVPADGTVNPLREGDLKSDDDDDDEAARPPVTESHAIKLAEADVSMEEGPISHEEEISPELVEKGIRILQKKILNQECSPPTLFAVLQVVAANIHEGIIARQKVAAKVMLAAPNWGEQVSAIKIKEEKRVFHILYILWPLQKF